MKFRTLCTAIVLTTVILTSTRTARAQYVVTETTSGGSETIVGSGTLHNLGSSTSPVALSASGTDNVTIDAGAVATGTAKADTIAFTTSGNTLLNNGTIT